MLLGVSWVAGILAAYVIGFAMTATSQPEHPGSPRIRASLVGTGALLLAFLAGAQINLLRDRRRHPNARYRSPHGFRYRTIPEALHHNMWAVSISAAFIAVGLWLRHL